MAIAGCNYGLPIPGHPPRPTLPEETANAKDCPDVAFTKQSDDGAFQIMVNGVSCDEAIEVVKGADQVTCIDENQNPKPCGFSRGGFECHSGGTHVGATLPMASFECRRKDDKKGNAIIVFVH